MGRLRPFLRLTHKVVKSRDIAMLSLDVECMAFGAERVEILVRTPCCRIAKERVQGSFDASSG